MEAAVTQIPLRRRGADPWTRGRGAWLIVGHPSADATRVPELSASGRFAAADLAAAWQEVTGAWTHSLGWFMLVRVDVLRLGSYAAPEKTQAPITANAFADACPLWNNGPAAVGAPFVWLALEGPDHLLGRGAGLPTYPSARARDADPPAGRALGGEVVAALYWHIHM